MRRSTVSACRRMSPSLSKIVTVSVTTTKFFGNERHEPCECSSDFGRAKADGVVQSALEGPPFGFATESVKRELMTGVLIGTERVLLWVVAGEAGLVLVPDFSNVMFKTLVEVQLRISSHAGLEVQSVEDDARELREHARGQRLDDHRDDVGVAGARSLEVTRELKCEPRASGHRRLDNGHCWPHDRRGELHVLRLVEPANSSAGRPMTCPVGNASRCSGGNETMRSVT